MGEIIYNILMWAKRHENATTIICSFIGCALGLLFAWLFIR